MSLRGVPLAVTEEAIQAIEMGATGLLAATSPARISTTHGRLGTMTSEQFALQSRYVRIVSAVEAFVDCVSSDLFWRRSDESAFIMALISSAEGRADQNWRARKESFSAYHAVSLTERAQWAKIQAAIEVRNAVAHGLGRLTRRQRESAVALNRITGLRISVHEGVVHLATDDIDKLRGWARAFVLDLDSVVRDEHGHVPASVSR